MVPDGSASRWFAVRVRPQRERRIVEAFRHKGYEPFLPLYRSRRRWSDRLKEIELPLFPGYVFCRFQASLRLPILTTPGVVYVVGVGRAPAPIDDGEVAALQAVVRSGLYSQPWRFLRAGQRVQIVAGPLCGLEGIYLDSRGGNRLVVSVTLLQRSVGIEIDSRWARAIGPVQSRPPGASSVSSGRIERPSVGPLAAGEGELTRR